eukprot:GHVH01010661.1.p1 GENE.GHVH01010661.1~~GHVH01010661.1.p1  ORF type:complete len:1438 (-),score=177.02 GHVH01010661.1:2024-6052(-)
MDRLLTIAHSAGLPITALDHILDPIHWPSPAAETHGFEHSASPIAWPSVRIGLGAKPTEVYERVHQILELVLENYREDLPTNLARLLVTLHIESCSSKKTIIWQEFICHTKWQHHHLFPSLVSTALCSTLNNTKRTSPSMIQLIVEGRTFLGFIHNRTAHSTAHNIESLALEVLFSLALRSGHISSMLAAYDQFGIQVPFPSDEIDDVVLSTAKLTNVDMATSSFKDASDYLKSICVSIESLLWKVTPRRRADGVYESIASGSSPVSDLINHFRSQADGVISSQNKLLMRDEVVVSLVSPVDDRSVSVSTPHYYDSLPPERSTPSYSAWPSLTEVVLSLSSVCVLDVIRALKRPCQVETSLNSLIPPPLINRSRLQWDRQPISWICLKYRTRCHDGFICDPIINLPLLPSPLRERLNDMSRVMRSGSLNSKGDLTAICQCDADMRSVMTNEMGEIEFAYRRDNHRTLPQPPTLHKKFLKSLNDVSVELIRKTSHDVNHMKQGFCFSMGKCYESAMQFLNAAVSLFGDGEKVELREYLKAVGLARWKRANKLSKPVMDQNKDLEGWSSLSDLLVIWYYEGQLTHIFCRTLEDNSNSTRHREAALRLWFYHHMANLLNRVLFLSNEESIFAPTVEERLSLPPPPGHWGAIGETIEETITTSVNSDLYQCLYYVLATVCGFQTEEPKCILDDREKQAVVLRICTSISLFLGRPEIELDVYPLLNCVALVLSVGIGPNEVISILCQDITIDDRGGSGSMIESLVHSSLVRWHLLRVEVILFVLYTPFSLCGEVDVNELQEDRYLMSNLQLRELTWKLIEWSVTEEEGRRPLGIFRLVRLFLNTKRLTNFQTRLFIANVESLVRKGLGRLSSNEPKIARASQTNIIDAALDIAKSNISNKLDVFRTMTNESSNLMKPEFNKFTDIIDDSFHQTAVPIGSRMQIIDVNFELHLIRSSHIPDECEPTERREFIGPTATGFHWWGTCQCRYRKTRFFPKMMSIPDINQYAAMKRDGDINSILAVILNEIDRIQWQEYYVGMYKRYRGIGSYEGINFCGVCLITPFVTGDSKRYLDPGSVPESFMRARHIDLTTLKSVPKASNSSENVKIFDNSGSYNMFQRLCASLHVVSPMTPPTTYELNDLPYGSSALLSVVEQELMTNQLRLVMLIRDLMNLRVADIATIQAKLTHSPDLNDQDIKAFEHTGILQEIPTNTKTANSISEYGKSLEFGISADMAKKRDEDWLKRIVESVSLGGGTNRSSKEQSDIGVITADDVHVRETWYQLGPRQKVQTLLERRQNEIRRRAEWYSERVDDLLETYAAMHDGYYESGSVSNVVDRINLLVTNNSSMN